MRIRIWTAAFCLVMSGLVSSLAAQPLLTHTFGRVFMGNLGNPGEDAMTELLFTNRDPNQVSCQIKIYFSQGAFEGPSILFDGLSSADNSIERTIPRGGTLRVRLTTNGELVAGIAGVGTVLPCNKDSISASGRFLIESDGGLKELFTIRPNTTDQWVVAGHCAAISTVLHRVPDAAGFGNDLGIAVTGLTPVPAPDGTSFGVTVFDSAGTALTAEAVFAFDGVHTAFFPLVFFPEVSDGPLTLIICLKSSESFYDVDITPIQVGTDSKGGVQFDSAIFADGFESGNVTAWSANN